MNKTGRKFGLATLLAVCLVAAAGVAAMRGTWQGPGAQTALSRSDELVSFVAKFEPSPRQYKVTITVEAGPHGTHTTRNDSPWVYEAMVAPGTVVKMAIVQIEEGFVECKIRKGLKQLARQDNSRLKGHQVLCQATT